MIVEYIEDSPATYSGNGEEDTFLFIVKKGHKGKVIDDEVCHDFKPMYKILWDGFKYRTNSRYHLIEKRRVRKTISLEDELFEI